MSALELGLGILATTLALIPLSSYLVSRYYYHPRISLVVAGQQSGNPIPLPSSVGSIMFGITADTEKEIVLEEVRVDFDPDVVKLSEDTNAVTNAWQAVADKGTVELEVMEVIDGEETKNPQQSSLRATEFPSLDTTFRMAIRLSGMPIVKHGFVKAYACKYEAKNSLSEFRAKISVYYRLQDYEIRSPWDMFMPKTYRYSEVFQFHIDKDFKGDTRDKMLRYGFRLGPRKTFIMGKTLEDTK